MGAEFITKILEGRPRREASLAARSPKCGAFGTWSAEFITKLSRPPVGSSLTIRWPDILRGGQGAKRLWPPAVPSAEQLGRGGAEFITKFTSLSPGCSIRCIFESLFRETLHQRSIGQAIFPDPMYREKLVPGKFTSNFPVFHIRLVLKSLPPEIFTSNPGLTKIR